VKKIDAPAPEGVSLHRDEYGIPHIVTGDLAGAYWGMGYAHAMDRGAQIGLMRLLGQGRVAECLDGSDESVEIDTFFRRMNWFGNTAGQVDLLTPETKSLLDAYCDGINARFDETRPWEFRALGYDPEPWTVEDVLLMARMTGYLTLAVSQAEVERLFVEMVQAGIDDARLDALFPGCLDGLDRDLVEQVDLGERIVPDAVRWLDGAPRTMASNNWAVASWQSVTGAALLANDPHLEVNRLPAIWVEQVIELPDDTVFTANMPGLAGPLVGRKDSLSWGATYAFMDSVDSWVEDCSPDGYRRGDTYVPFTERHEQILVKKGEPVDVVFYENEHGILDGDPAGGGYRLATRWAPADSGAATLNAVTDLWTATGVDDAVGVFGRIETAWNWVMADATGRIAYQMSGQYPLRDEAWDGFVPKPGWEARWDWKGFAAPESLPRVIDPPEGIVVTANNDLNDLGDVRPINMPMGDYRARRITDLLTESLSSLATFRRIHQDTYSLQAEAFMTVLEPLLPDTPVGTTLKAWNRSYDCESHGATIFEAFYRNLIVEVFGTGGFGASVVDHLVDATGVFIDFYRNFDRVLLSEDTAWFAGRDRENIYRTAFERVGEDADRRWCDGNRVTMTNILLGGKTPGAAGFDVGPIEIPGGRATPHQGQIYESAGRQTSFVPSLRIMADMGLPGLFTALAGGPSDRRFSRLYTSDLERWRRGEYKTLRRSSERG